MPKPFDATTKELLESDPRAWLELLLGRQLGDVRILNVDLSTITTEADSVLLVQEVEPWLVHRESNEARDWSGADLEAARQVGPNHLDFARLLPEVERRLA
jgi:hypothetical protein